MATANRKKLPSIFELTGVLLKRCEKGYQIVCHNFSTNRTDDEHNGAVIF
jgi:hypothetical protein